MDIRSLSARGIANLSYAYLSTGYIQRRISEAEDAHNRSGSKTPLTDDDRHSVVEEAIRDFDAELNARPVAGVDPERVARARANARAIRMLTRDMGMANTGA